MFRLIGAAAVIAAIVVCSPERRSGQEGAAAVDLGSLAPHATDAIGELLARPELAKVLLRNAASAGSRLDAAPTPPERHGRDRADARPSRSP